MAKATARARALARPHTENAIETLVELMTQDDVAAATRLAAAKALLEHTFGGPERDDDEGEDQRPLSELTMDELRAGMARSLRELNAHLERQRRRNAEFINKRRVEAEK